MSDFRILSDDPEAFRHAKNPELHVFDGKALMCVTTSAEYSRQIVEALSARSVRSCGTQIEDFRMRAAGHAYGTATKRKLKTAIEAYLSAMPPYEDLGVEF